MDYFVLGEKIDFRLMPMQQAIAILGEPIFDLLREYNGIDFEGSMRVKSVNRATKTITLEWSDD